VLLSKNEGLGYKPICPPERYPTCTDQLRTLHDWVCFSDNTIPYGYYGKRQKTAENLIDNQLVDFYFERYAHLRHADAFKQR